MAKRSGSEPKAKKTGAEDASRAAGKKRGAAKPQPEPPGSATPVAAPAPATAAATPGDTADWIDAAFAAAGELSAAGLGVDTLGVKPLAGLRQNQVVALDSFIGTDRDWFSATFKLAPITDPLKRNAQIAAIRLAMAAFLRAYPEMVNLVASAQSCPPAQNNRGRLSSSGDAGRDGGKGDDPPDHQ